MLKEDRNIKWYLKPVSVVPLLFFVLGPVGLPLLYKSPKFSEALKRVLTLVVIVYPSYLIFASLQVAKELYRRMEELQDILRVREGKRTVVPFSIFSNSTGDR
jgi:hypothetical protein